MKDIHTKRTLMNYSKKELVEHCMALENNVKVLNERFENQYNNCMQIVEDMNLLNKTYKNRNLKED